MKRTKNLRVLCTLAAALLISCQSPGPGASEPEQLAPDEDCVVTQASYQRIYDRHCTATAGGSQLLPRYCTHAAAAQNLCRMVQNAPQKTRVLLSDGRVRYSARFDAPVGTAGERCGLLVINAAGDGTVAALFPQPPGASGACP